MICLLLLKLHKRTETLPWPTSGVVLGTVFQKGLCDPSVNAYSQASCLKQIQEFFDEDDVELCQLRGLAI